MLQPARSLPGGEPRSYLDVAINCAESVMRSRIMCAPNDKQGVVFFGAREKRGVDENNALGVRDGVFVEQRMGVPSARRIQARASRALPFHSFHGSQGFHRFHSLHSCV